ncbi:MAG: ATP-dependent metallopeptidase FtsH/Yme1/Tma family protein [Chloroflexota bacterium]|nr:MAG: ATP-dependent metallopeptidase FtsH/Yme1/Tma family protein [Chloroflexota bacterium]
MLLAILGMTILAIFFINYTTQGYALNTVPYTQFREQVVKGNVSSVVFNGQQIEGTFDPPLENEIAAGETTKIVSFRTYIPPIPDNRLLDLLNQKGVTVETRPQTSSSPWMMVLNWLPIIVIGLLIFQFFRRTFQGQGEGPTSMLQTRASLYDKEHQRVTFHDVAGLAGVKLELQEVIEFLQNPQKFKRFGATVPKGVLLVGPPGTGKTLLARAVAGEAKAAFFPISGSDFIELFVGVGASRVRDLFKKAKDNAPSIIFIDELDSIGRRRGTGYNGGHEEREQTLNQLLAEMDGFEKHENIILMAATNRPDVLDSALLRPGRFDRQIVVDSPTYSERLAILRVHGRNKPFSSDVDLETIAHGTPGFSGADLSNLLNESALLAIRRNKLEISSQEINDAADKIVMGLERELILTESEKRLLACHEAGHATVAAFLPNTDPIHKVNIIPRGRAMGVTQQVPDRDRYIFNREYILDRLAVLMAGRAAEELVFDAVTSGAADDLKQATRFARKMVLELGMSEELGHISLRSEQEANFLDDDWNINRDYSELTAQKADQEISQILESAYVRAKEILEQHREGLDRVIEALLEKEQILGPELIAILNAGAQPVDES